MNDLVELKKASVEKQDPDVLITRYRDGVSISEADAKEIDGAHLTMSQGNDMFIIVDLTFGDAQISSEAEEYFVYKGKMIPYIKGIAIISKHKSSFFAKLFGRSTKTLYPTKEFITFEEAQDWFKKLR
ncbi:MAG: hypothetical protein BM555_03270 [Crocinitomix sp. MedPE-SWsnd]|jgi:hypothetical protein|nr:MAG: hypothetical protein BM555_03270 [Crocinitomix sp. MedPE-SWsnd]